MVLLLFRAGDNVLTESEPFDPKFNYIIKEYNIEEITQLLMECVYDVIEIEENRIKMKKIHYVQRH